MRSWLCLVFSAPPRRASVSPTSPHSSIHNRHTSTPPPPQALHAGVVRDMERQERKRLNRIDQDQQLELRKQLEAEESKWKGSA